MATIGIYNFTDHYKGDTFNGAQFTFYNETPSNFEYRIDGGVYWDELP